MSKFSQKYDLNVEAEVRNWIQQLTGESIGEYELEARCKDGTILCKLMQVVFQGTPEPNLPPKCKNMKVKCKQSERPAVHMGNIEIFLNAAEAYGVPQSGIFAPNDLYDGKNMPMVMATILQVGSECQRNKFDGPTIGSKPAPRQPKKQFSRQQIRQGYTFLSPQQGTNKYASQKGMSFGSVRHCADIRADELNQEGQGEMSLQSGTNKFASQKGMAFGSIRHISDIKADDMRQESQGELNLQSGTNKFASQKGMSFGGVRHCADIRADGLCQEGAGEIGSQMGSNKYASQKGMSFGSVRHVGDIKATDACQEGAGEIGLQMGSNKFASQKGMSFGTVRHVSDIKSDGMCAQSQGELNMQSGWNKGASQSGMRGFGAARHVADIKVTELFEEYDEDGMVAEDGYMEDGEADGIN